MSIISLQEIMLVLLVAIVIIASHVHLCTKVRRDPLDELILTILSQSTSDANCYRGWEALRARYRDPRVHFAVNCASKGCPPLYGEPFTGRDLDRQLDHVTRAFINDPDRYRLEGDTLHVSRIFKWFAEDFNDDPVGFFKSYAEEPLRSKLDAVSGDVRVRYLDYDWSLNGT